MMRLTERQRVVFANVIQAHLRGERYRAANSGERVTLSSLYRRWQLLVRWAWRGREGDSNAAHEYDLHPMIAPFVRREMKIASKKRAERTE
jgi:hypothetical protein